MALSSLLEIINRAEDEMGLARSSAVVASSNSQPRQLLAFAQAAGRDLMRSHDWSRLITLATVTTSNGTSAYNLESDFDRMVSDAAWDRTNDRFMIGPDTVQVNRYLNESGIASVGVHKRYRMTGSTLTIWPTPTATETLVYEYVSNKWARSSGGTAQTEFAADTDTSVFDPDLLKAEIKWRFMSGKGMNAEALYKEASDLRSQKIAADLGGLKLHLDGAGLSEQFIGLGNVADSNWDA